MHIAKHLINSKQSDVLACSANWRGRCYLKPAKHFNTNTFIKTHKKTNHV